MYIHGMLENAIDVNRCTFHILICAKKFRSFSTRLKKKNHSNPSSPIFKLLIRRLLKIMN